MSDSGNALGNANGMYFILLRFRKKERTFIKFLKGENKILAQLNCL